MTVTDNRKKFFHYLFTTAIEGGIDDWAVVEAYSWSKTEGKMADGKVVEDLDNFYATITSTEDDWGVDRLATGYAIGDNEELRIDLSVIERGWYKFMDLVLRAVKEERNDVSFSDPYYRQAIIQYLTDMEDGDSDANVADIVVQLGLFGEYVYG